MKIEVGKRYINAEGDVVKIIRNNPNYLCGYYSYTGEGLRFGEKQSPQDLICEVVPEIEDLFARNYLSQREFLERHIKHWTEYEQNDL